MKLAKPFYRLPVRFDVERLRAEVAALPPDAWSRHPNDYAGNTAARLVTVGGGQNDSVGGAMAITPALRDSRYLQQAIGSFRTVISRCRLMRIAPGDSVPHHSDVGTPRASVTLTPDSGHDLRAGTTLSWTVTVENRGDGPFRRLRAFTVAEKNPLLDRREFVFGTVRPGEKTRWTVPAKLPPGMDTRREEVPLRFEDAAGKAPADVRTIVSVLELPKPAFAFSVQVEDTKGGNGGGLVQRKRELARCPAPVPAEALTLAMVEQPADLEAFRAGVVRALAPVSVAEAVLSRYVYHNNGGAPYMSDPSVAAEYYNFLRGIWKDNTIMLYGGNAHYSSGAVGPETDFMFPDDSDPCNWGTSFQPPNGEKYWTEETAGNNPDDRRFMQSAGPFTLKPGAVNYITVGIPWARAL